uniref:Fas-binding factor 1 C-terminal domain-containing protein n=1 Tax=Canis lupus familiaris TaxID=9615 RepID=A0A8C0LX71_CANLF
MIPSDSFLPRLGKMGLGNAQAPKTKKGLKGSIDDVLGDLLGDELTLPEEPVKLASRSRDAQGVAQALPSSRARTKSLLEDYAFSTTAGLTGLDAEVSDVSDADPQNLLQTLKDLDDMDADLLGLKKSNLTSNRRAAKGSGKEELPSRPKPASILTASEKGDATPAKKPPPSPNNFGHQNRKFSFKDLEDPLAGLLSDDEEGITKKPPGAASKVASEKSPAPVRDQGPSIPLTPGDTPVRKREEVLFDEEDDVMATLGFADSPTADRRQMGDQEGPRSARSRLDELLGLGTATKLLARPGTGERREFRLDKRYQRPQDKEDPRSDEDFIFGDYQPTVGSGEGRQCRRQSVRFLAEGGADPKGEPGSKQSTLAASSPTHPKKGGADWLGLKDEDLLPPSPTGEAEAQKGGSALSTSSVLPPKSQHSAPGRHSTSPGLPSSSSGAKLPTGGADILAKASQASKLGASEEKEEEDWLSHALSRKKSQDLAREEHSEASKGQNLVGAGGSPPASSQPVTSAQEFEQAATGGPSGTTQKPPTRPATSGSPVTWNRAASTLPVGDPKKGTALGDLSSAEPAAGLPRSQEPTGPSLPAQPLLPEALVQSLLPGTEYQRQLLAAQVQLQSGTTELQADLLQSQAQLAELEAQVRKLELERAQHQLLLESLQQRHQADLELIESAHRSRIKVLETSYQQREERLRREHEELSARYLSHCQEAEQAHAELTAQHQRRLAAAMQEKDQEMERLRELQRASILEMRKDHEEQLQRMKLLKDREIDAVTSATSHTRSLNGIIEQMEKFSSSLHELSSRVEASHLTTTQERELGLRQHDQQLRALQERLGQQQRDMEEERSRLQEVIGKMEARLNEQSRLLEQERWRVNAEQSRVESTQRALEEQRKVMVQQIAMEREELEKAKEQAELKIRASELRAKEEQLAVEREALERERQELRLEKERVSTAALRTRLRAEEVESMSQVASEKFEEGQRALCEARQVQQQQQARLQLVQQQQEHLRQQEQHMHQEHLSLAHQRLRLDRIRQDLPSSPVVLLPKAQGPAASCLSAIVAPTPTVPQGIQPPTGLGPSLLHAKLVLLKHTAEQDRDFLENEQFFLETLKKASYNMTSHSA